MSRLWLRFNGRHGVAQSYSAASVNGSCLFILNDLPSWTIYRSLIGQFIIYLLSLILSDRNHCHPRALFELHCAAQNRKQILAICTTNACGQTSQNTKMSRLCEPRYIGRAIYCFPRKVNTIISILQISFTFLMWYLRSVDGRRHAVTIKYKLWAQLANAQFHFLWRCCTSETVAVAYYMSIFFANKTFALHIGHTIICCLCVAKTGAVNCYYFIRIRVWEVVRCEVGPTCEHVIPFMLDLRRKELYY